MPPAAERMAAYVKAVSGDMRALRFREFKYLSDMFLGKTKAFFLE
jgi:hypothetical protein